MAKYNYAYNRKAPVSCNVFDDPDVLDPEHFHILLIKRGSIWLNMNGMRCYINGSSVLCLSKPFQFNIQYTCGLEAVHLSFAPEYIHFDLNWKIILSTGYEDKSKRLRWPDFNVFLKHDEIFIGVLTPDDDSLSCLISLFDSVRNQIKNKPDERWNCRSRFYMLRIFHILNTIRSGITTNTKIDPLFLQAKTYIANHIHEKLTIEIMCRYLLIDKNKLNRLFQINSKMSYSKYINTQRLDIACENLAIGNLKTTDIMTMVGFNDHANFINFFKRYTGVTPSQYRQMAKNERNRMRNQ